MQQKQRRWTLVTCCRLPACLDGDVVVREVRHGVYSSTAAPDICSIAFLAVSLNRWTIYTPTRSFCRSIQPCVPNAPPCQKVSFDTSGTWPSGSRTTSHVRP